MLKSRILITVIIVLLYNVLAIAGDVTSRNKNYYDKHVIIAVQRNCDYLKVSDGRRDAIYKTLCGILKGNDVKNSRIPNIKIPKSFSGFSFNPETDKISLFGFGLKCTNNVTWNTFINSHFTRYSGYLPNSGVTLDAFLKNDLNNLLQYESADLALAYYTDPLILTKLKDAGLAKEYYLIIISPFLAGGAKTSADYDPERVEKDYKQLYSILNKEYENLDALFGKQVDLFKINTVNTDKSKKADHYNSIKMSCHKVTLRALDNVSVTSLSNVELRQKSYGSSQYNVISNAKIVFANQEDVRIDSVSMYIYDDANGIVHRVGQLGFDWIEKGHNETSYYEVSVPGNVLELGKHKEGDVLRFEYVFYTTVMNMSNNGGNKDLLSFVFEVQQEFTFQSNVFPMAPIWLYIILGLIMIAAIATAIAVWRYRGRYAKASVNVEISHISKQRYMNISANKDDGIHVTNAPCWYIRPGTNEQRIHVICSMQRIPMKFARKYRIRLSYMVKDNDENYDFNFRPDGRERDGNLRKADIWYPIPNASTEDAVVFEFNAIAYIEQGKRPDFIGRENILKLGVCLKAELIDSMGKVIRLLDEKNDVPYEFIAREYFPNRELWMAFDPGTSGSCVAYGFGGTVVDKNNIHLARNYARYADGTEGWDPIFPSKIKISDSSSLFDNPHKVEEAIIIQENNGGDYWFGNAAEQLSQENPRNSFQSIKKLLGYSNKLPIKRNTPRPTVQMIAGRDLAHLLIKGIINRFERYLSDYSGDDNGTNDRKALEEVRPKLISENGEFQPSRAIVTIPNNFTLVKIYDMVESIYRTKLFKEVHFLYEAEGTLMTYLRDTWSSLKANEKKNIIVFDMGGATINASAFTIDVTMRKYKGNSIVDNVTVRTVSRIGYGIGGDDIDYALILIICSLPSISKCIGNKERFMRRYKTELLKFVKDFKLSYIDKVNKRVKAGNILINMETLWGSLRTSFSDWGITLPEDFDPADELYLKMENSTRRTMNKYVLNNVKDAISELVDSPNIKKGDVEIIFSGRSTLYPGVKETVMKHLEAKYSSVVRWTGFDKAHSKDVIILDDEKVKTAVVMGACWYAMWSQYITVRHDIVTSAFGFIDMKDNKEVFHPVVKHGEILENGHKKRKVEVFDPGIPNISFVQMLGTNYDEIWNKKIYHKMNKIVQLTDIEGEIDKVEIDVDNKNNFRYKVKEKNGVSHGGQDIIKDIDILDENSEAYLYAAYTSEKTKNKQQETTKKVAVSDDNSSQRRGGGL